MKKMKTRMAAVMVLSMVLITAAFVGKTIAKDQKTDKDKNLIKVGTFATSAIAANAGVAPLKEMGYEVNVIIFDDAVLPNTALQEGSIDLNIFQHTPYLEAFMKNNHGEPLSMVNPLLFYPNYGLYSKKYETLGQIPEKAVIGLYNDASNIDRGLKVLNACGLIKLTDEKKDLYNVFDIVENPKNLKFYEMAFGTAVRALDDVDASMAAASHILRGGLDPRKALAFETPNDVFACGITVRTADMNSNWVKDVVKAYTSDASRDAINTGYKGASVPLF